MDILNAAEILKSIKNTIFTNVNSFVKNNLSEKNLIIIENIFLKNNFTNSLRLLFIAGFGDIKIVVLNRLEMNF